jgi:hypothetical protein
VRITESIIAEQRRKCGMATSTSAPDAKAMPPRGMNKLEQEYARHLELRKLAGEIRDYRFEAVHLRLCDGQGGKARTYKPDFLVVLADGRVEIHEVKGWQWQAGMLRFDFAAQQFPFWTFRMFGRDAHGWVERCTHLETK